jgi:hypothetical protein
MSRVLRFKPSRRLRLGAIRPPPWAVRPAQAVRPHLLGRAVEPAWVAAPPHRIFGLGFVAQPSNLMIFW